MASGGRRVCSDVLVSAGVLTAVLAVLVSIDVRVRDQVRGAMNAAAHNGISDAGTAAREVTLALIDAARTQSVEHAPLVIFAAVATVLLLALARS